MANVLCIDIGGTRIKAAILNDQITLSDLEKADIKVIDTLGWMNSSLPQIISTDHWASLLHPDKGFGQYDKISISVPFKVSDNGNSISGHYVNDYGIPHNLPEAFRIRANCEVHIMNDGVAWMKGALKYLQLCSSKIELPCLGIILGTGVGLAYSESNVEVKAIEVGEYNCAFTNLSDSSNEYIRNGAKIHKVLGKNFFQEVKEKRRKWSYIKIRNEYTERLIGLLSDFEKANLFNYKRVKSIIIGGGNAGYVCLPNLKYSINKTIHIFSNNHIPPNTINPDVIPLLGLLG